MGDSWVVRHKKKYRKRVEAESILIGGHNQLRNLQSRQEPGQRGRDSKHLEMRVDFSETLVRSTGVSHQEIRGLVKVGEWDMQVSRWQNCPPQRPGNFT